MAILIVIVILIAIANVILIVIVAPTFIVNHNLRMLCLRGT